jgi:hypothetical protein
MKYLRVTHSSMSKEVELVSTETILSCILLHVQEILFALYFLSLYEW